jgi:hypothetical protein
MFKSRHRAAFAAMICACVFSACGDPPEQKDVSVPVAPANAPPKTASIGKDMVAAVSSAASSSVIGVHFALRAPPTVNTALPVEVAMVPHRDLSSIVVRFDSQDGLAVTAGDIFGPKDNLKSEVPLTNQMELLPMKEGIFTVSAIVETDGPDGNSTRVFSIPVIVAALPAAVPADTPVSAPTATPAPQPAGN